MNSECCSLSVKAKFQKFSQGFEICIIEQGYLSMDDIPKLNLQVLMNSADFESCNIDLGMVGIITP